MRTSLGQQSIVSHCTVCNHQLSSWPWPCPHSDGRSRLWWSNLTYVPVSYTAWHDPLISKSKGPNLPSVPRLKFRGAPTVPHCTPSRDAKEQKVTFQLSVSLTQNSNSSQLQGYSEKAWIQVRHHTASTDYKKRRKEFGVFVYFVYNVKKEQGRVRLKSAASAFQLLTVCFCMHAQTPCARLLVRIGSVCWGWG